MDEELTWRYRRWRDADQSGRDDDADAACKALFAAAMAEPRISSDFASRTVAVVADARTRELRAARRARRATVAGSLAATLAGIYVGGPWVLSMLSATLVGSIDLLVGLTVQVATGLDAGGDLWTLLAGLGRAGAALVSNPAVTIAILAMQGIAMAALIVLQRLLGPDRESFK